MDALAITHNPLADPRLKQVISNTGTAALAHTGAAGASTQCSLSSGMWAAAPDDGTVRDRLGTCGAVASALDPSARELCHPPPRCGVLGGMVFATAMSRGALPPTDQRRRVIGWIMNQPEPLGHLAELSVAGLFGVTDFSFRLDLKEPTLLTGSNGSGKSTVLRMIDAIGTGAWQSLARMPFNSIELAFEHGQACGVYRRKPDVLDIRLNDESFVVQRDDFDPNAMANISDTEIMALLPGVHPAGSGMYEFRGGYLDRDDVLRLLDSRGFSNFTEEKAPLAKFASDFHLLFITDQRLVVSDERLEAMRRMRPTRMANKTAAELSARELGRQMQQALSAYASESQRLDRDFPQRVVRAMASDEEIPVGRIEELLRDVEKERVALQAVGLLPRDLSAEAFQDLPLHEPNVRPVIETFVRDTRSKFAVLADLRDRLTLFVEFLNQHYENKRVITQPKEGFRVEIEGDTERTVSPSQLSSGEQQILVLAYEVLFRSEPQTLVLIDEPELSLHVLWQDTFIDDLARMGNVRNLQFILATHSPSLIGGRDDLKRSLDAAR